MTTIAIKTYKNYVLLSPPIIETLPVPLVFKAELSGITGVTSCKWELIYNDSVIGDIVITDQTTSSAVQFSNIFTAPAAYKVNLTIIDNSVSPITYTYSLDVVINENVSIYANPGFGAYPLTVAFIPLTLSETDPLRNSIQWDFKNSGSYDSAEFSPTYVYNEPFNYTCRVYIKWIFIDKYNSDNFVYITLVKTIKIYVTFNSLLLNVAVNPQQGRIPLTVAISGISNNPVTTWDWYINNVLQASHSQAIEKTFNQRGTYAIKLVATDDYGSGYFVSVGNTGALFISSDGSSWSIKPSSTVNDLKSVTYGDNKFVVVGNTGTIIASGDALTWVNKTSGTVNTLYSVIYGGGQFVAVGDLGTVITSIDGSVWAIITSGVSSKLYFVTYGGGLYVAVGEAGAIIVSSDGISWDAKTSGISENINSVCYGDGQFIAVGDTGKILSSANGTDWVSQDSGTSENLKSYGEKQEIKLAKQIKGYTLD